MITVSWNQAAALQRLDGDNELLAELCELFFRDFPSQMSYLMESLANGNYQAVSKTAHTLKGGLGYLGAEEGEQLAHEIEEACQRHGTAAVQELASMLSDYVEALRNLMLSHSGAPDRVHGRS